MTTTQDTIHCFEKAGLGKAPFTYAGMEHQDIRHDNQRVIGSVGGCEVTTKPGGTCAYCGTYIVNMFNVESADGNRFHVGCECIKKTGDAGLIRKVECAVRKMNAERRKAKKIADAKADQAYCEHTMLHYLGTISSLPHPHPYRASQGETLGDWANFMFEMKNWKTLATTLRLALGK